MTPTATAIAPTELQENDRPPADDHSSPAGFHGHREAAHCRERRFATVVLLTLWAGLACGGAPAESGNLALERQIVASEWDTVFQLGSPNPEDTTLYIPGRLEVWNDRLAVTDLSHYVRLFSASGERLWTAGGEGRGPGEFVLIIDMEVNADGNLWALDGVNAKVAEISPGGEIVGETRLDALQVPPHALVRAAGRAIFAANTPRTTVTVTDPEDLRVLSTSTLPWDLPTSWPGLPDRFVQINLRLKAAAEVPGRTRWVSALYHGPGFAVWRGDSVSVHRYVDPVPYAVKSGPPIMRAGADSARYGATAIASAGDEIFVLFGGRPVRMEHAAEPTVLIDVYGFDGVYRRSYRLPSDTRTMTTDGETFYVIEETGYPSVLALRPRRDGAPVR